MILIISSSIIIVLCIYVIIFVKCDVNINYKCKECKHSFLAIESLYFSNKSVPEVSNLPTGNTEWYCIKCDIDFNGDNDIDIRKNFLTNKIVSDILLNRHKLYGNYFKFRDN